MPNLHIQKLSELHPEFHKFADQYRAQGMELVGLYKINTWLHVIVTRDGKKALWHMSVSHPRRYPTWDEIREIRYAILPDNITMGMLLPPIAQYVNLHPNCFHLHEVPECHEADTVLFHGH